MNNFTNQKGDELRESLLTRTNGSDDRRHVICDSGTGVVSDDAQDYGFKPEEAAINYGLPKGWLTVKQIPKKQ